VRSPAASSIFSFNHVSVMKAILTSYWSSIIFNSSTFGKSDLVFERRKVSKLLWAHKFGLIVWLIREILVKLFLLPIVCCLGLLMLSRILQMGEIRCAPTDWFVVGSCVY
jgi:hypothetical protein